MSSDRASLCPDSSSAYIASPRVLVVDRELGVQRFLRDFFVGLEVEVEVAADIEEARQSLSENRFDIVMADVMAPGRAGLRLVRDLQAHACPPAAMMMAACGSLETAIEAIRCGAVDFHVKPLDSSRLKRSVGAVLAARRARLTAPPSLENHWSALQKALSRTPSHEAQLGLVKEAARQGLGDVAVTLERGVPEGFLTAASPPLGVPCLRLDVAHGGQTQGTLVCLGLTRTRCFSEAEQIFLGLLASQTGLIFEAATLEEAKGAVAAQTMQALARALEAKDAYTFGHSDRVALYAARLAQELGLGPAGVARLHQGGLMHDIGKIGIRSSDLNTQGPLTWEQKSRFRMHPVFGRNIVEPMAALHPLIPAIYHHHEAYDGTGYPDGLEGDDIPLDARILSVADSYDAMTSDRAYRVKMSDAAARAELARCAGTQFDPHIVRTFLAMSTPTLAQAEPFRPAAFG